MLCLITTPTLAAVGVALEIIGILIATATLTRIWVNLLQTSGQTIGNSVGTTQGLGNGLDMSMFAANCAPISVAQLPIIPIFAAIPSNPLLTLLLGMFLLRLGSPTPT
jgi:hypothetical protein